MILLLGGFEQAANLHGKKSNVNWKTSKMVNFKRIRIRPKDSANVACDGRKKMHQLVIMNQKAGCEYIGNSRNQ